MKAYPRHPKARGDLTEIRFLLMAAACGLVVCKPWGDNQPFDFLVYCKRTQRTFRVQVKSGTWRHRHGYAVITKRANDQRYTRRDIDFVAAYVIPANAWYIVPIGALKGRKTIYVYPTDRPSRGGMYESYRESWQLLRK